ncbi:MAG TPA: hypothetical protein VN328_11480, partial [Thermodesulfovibrionales bacterium]|nr:hypothetical protein [Thermodesulfovibrionales bacterium]
ESIYGYPRLLVLGYGGLPFPAFKDFLADPAGKYFLAYWPILFYAFASVYLLTLFMLREINRDGILKISLLVFGILLFRIALGRSTVENTYRVLPPAILLLFLFLEASVPMFSQRHFLKVGNLIMSFILILSTSVLFINTDMIKETIASAWQDVIGVKYKFSLVARGNEIPSLKRGGIFYEPSTALSIMNIDSFLKANTGPGEYVYFFPNEAAYYFLFDRTNPTRYAISYFAITREQRRELVEDLEKKKPEYIVYSIGTWRVDDIREEIQVPEVLRYIQLKYVPHVNMGDVLILKRSAS